ncbi:Fic family protein [Candidatus Woesearchaeota archaeon]|nr:Fic family protein [Candidatus Woesearchaeota archaeon]
MVFIREKEVKGIKYKYIEKHLRLPDGTTKKISKIIRNNIELKRLDKSFFINKEKEIFANFAINKYTFHHPLSREEIIKIESMRVDYKNIMNQLKKKNALKDLLDRFTVNFTYETNALEGNSLTLKDVAIVLFENATIVGKDLREIYETRNARIIVDLFMQKRIKIDHKGIIKIHSILMREIDKERGYKTLPNYILGSNLKTSLPENVYKDMNDLLVWYHKNEHKIYPLELAVLFHGKFLKIHPFKDGNGRVARFLLNAMLTNKGYSPLIIRKSQRVSYLKCLHTADLDNTTPLMRFIIEKFKKTYRNFFEVYATYV